MSDQFTRDIADNLPVLSWMANPDGYIVWYNKRWYEYTGTVASEMEGWGWQSVHDPKELPYVLERWRDSISTGKPFEMVFPLRGADGSFEPFLTRVTPSRDAEGNVTAWFGVNTEIADQVKAEKALAVLSDEIGHRIKNIFAVVSGLISLSARMVPDCKGFAFELMQRIAALGKAHDFIRAHGSSTSTIVASSISDLLRQLLAPYQHDERIVIRGDDTRINEKAAMSLALLFHELATNSTKYGALSAASGRIEVTTKISTAALRVDWHEKEGPPVEPPTRLGFGSNLTRISIEAQLGGRITYDWEPDGLVVCASVPLDAVGPNG